MARAESLTREDYFRVGLGLLGESGIRSVTIDAVCSRLEVTKGSFYHHFRNGQDFQQQLVLYWEDVYGRIRPGDIEHLPPMERLEAQINVSLQRDHEAESAIRAWSRSDPSVAVVQQRLDQRRVDFSTATLEACGVPPARARVLAETGVALLVGYQSLGQPVDRARLRAAADELRTWIRHVIEQEDARRGRVVAKTERRPRRPSTPSTKGNADAD